MSDVRPMASSRFCNASRSILCKGRLVKIEIRALSIRYASEKARCFSASVPSAAAGSGTPQWAVIGWPGQTGQLSLAALSQTVNTKSSSGAPGRVNSSQSFDRAKPVSKFRPGCVWNPVNQGYLAWSVASIRIVETGCRDHKRQSPESSVPRPSRTSAASPAPSRPVCLQSDWPDKPLSVA
jgi:hypothetical protein